jgi:predicted phosphoribosyltransferase
MVFASRTDAGAQLAEALREQIAQPPRELPADQIVVLGLPRGGVPVAAEIAAAIGAPLDVIIVRKLGVPFQPELGMGAIGEAGARVISADVVDHAGVSERQIAAVEARERVELARRARRYRGGTPPLPLDGKIAVIVDDGIATGSTARAACLIARARGAARVILAVPVAPRGFSERIGADADDFVCLRTPTPFYSIGQFYSDFRPTSDREVIACLERGRGSNSADRAVPDRAVPDGYGPGGYGPGGYGPDGYGPDGYGPDG